MKLQLNICYEIGKKRKEKEKRGGFRILRQYWKNLIIYHSNFINFYVFFSPKRERERDGNYGIPNLELDRTGVDGDHASTEFDTNGEIMNRLESLVRELQEQAWFPYTCITPNYSFFFFALPNQIIIKT